MKYTTLFADLEDFRSYVDGLQADTTYRQLLPSMRATGQEMEKIIPASVLEAVMEANPDPQQADQNEDGKELLKTAVAAGTLYRYQIFSSVKKNGSDASLYKYQHEELKDTYAEAYWKAMDSLLDWLDAHDDVGAWNETQDYQARQQLPVRSAEEFHHYFGINRSSCFYAKVLYLIRECWKEIRPNVRGHEEDVDVMDAAKRALCYAVMAKVVKRFDVTEFPRSIRWDYNHEYTKGSSVQDRDRLYNELTAASQTALDEVAAVIRRLSEGDAVADTNEESNKHFLIF